LLNFAIRGGRKQWTSEDGGLDRLVLMDNRPAQSGGYMYVDQRADGVHAGVVAEVPASGGDSAVEEQAPSMVVNHCLA
jgi:hypothetical protein